MLSKFSLQGKFLRREFVRIFRERGWRCTPVLNLLKRFSKVRLIVILHSRFSSELTFENVFSTRNGFCDAKACGALSSALRENRTLKYLDLSSNRITEQVVWCSVV